jgi:hypothetical protein
MTFDAEIRLDIADELERIFSCTIALVHESENWNPPLFADVEQLPRSFFDAAPVVEKHHG